MQDREIIHAYIKTDHIICQAPLVAEEEMLPMFTGRVYPPPRQEINTADFSFPATTGVRQMMLSA